MLGFMRNAGLEYLLARLVWLTGMSAVAAIAGGVGFASAQNVPLISGGVGFFTDTNGGQTSYQPHIEPLIAAPIGKSLLVEGRGIIVEEFSPSGGGYIHSHFASLLYLQGDYIATPHLTVVAGSYLVPFNTYNDRLSEIWIENLQDGPLTAGIGTLGTGTGVGGMLSGNVASGDKFSISYNAWFSARSGNMYFNSDRSSGGRAYLYLPEARLEIGASYDRKLQAVQENFEGMHVWWEPKDTGLRVRSEWARGAHAQGYWVETDYRTHAFGGPDNWVGRIEPVFRIAQTFRINQLGSDSVPSVNTQRADFGLDYNLPHNVRILTSYGREFSSKDTNIWETGIVYRFLFPTWKGKAD